MSERPNIAIIDDMEMERDKCLHDVSYFAKKFLRPIGSDLATWHHMFQEGLLNGFGVIYEYTTIHIK